MLTHAPDMLPLIVSPDRHRRLGDNIAYYRERLTVLYTPDADCLLRRNP